MSSNQPEIQDLLDRGYDAGFVTDIEQDVLPPGLDEGTIRFISSKKNEPDWMLQYRLRAYDHFMKRPLPTWTDGLDRINFDNIVYYR